MTITKDITPEQQARARRAFEAAIDSAVPVKQIAARGLFTDEEEQFIQQEVARMLWEPKLPNAGAQERKWMKMLQDYARDESLVVGVKLACSRYAQAMEKCLPLQERIRKAGRWIELPGCYYSRKPVTATNNKDLFRLACQLRQEASEAKDYKRKWLAEFLLTGLPMAVSNFKLECLYLLRGDDGNVMRLVRLTNTKGEMSEGREIGGADVLPSDMGSSAEKFRQWVQSKGNFTWGCEGGAGNVELQLLQLDVTEDVAFRTVRLIEYVGWHELKASSRTGSLHAPGSDFRRGLWFMDECVYTPEGETLMPDDDGIFWYDTEGYALSRKGRELDFIQGRPQMRPEVNVANVEFDTGDWDPMAREIHRTNPLGGFFREVCRRFSDSAGGPEGWMSVGSILGFAAAPEVFARQGNFPSVWVAGQMGSGKTTYVAWLMSVCGFQLKSGMGLISKNVTAVGIACQLENYSNVPLWLDEFRQHQIAADKEPMLRDSYGRLLAGKWTPDGIQRAIRTMTVISGESTSSDAATRSRYPHVLLSESKRIGNHHGWMHSHQEFFALFFRELLIRRREFVALVLKQIDMWMAHPDLQAVSSRDRITHAVSYAAMAAASVLFESHDSGEITAFRRFMANHASSAAADVQSDVNVNVFIQDLVTAYEQDAIPEECFLVKTTRVNHPPGSPNQTAGGWNSYELYIEPHGAIAALQMWLRKGNAETTLRYKDYRDQLSKNSFWIPNRSATSTGLRMRMSRAGEAKSVKVVWGIYVDKHPLGLQSVSDEEFEASMAPAESVPLGTIGPVFLEGDPRKGPLFAIIEGILRWEQQKS